MAFFNKEKSLDYFNLVSTGTSATSNFNDNKFHDAIANMRNLQLTQVSSHVNSYEYFKRDDIIDILYTKSNTIGPSISFKNTQNTLSDPRLGTIQDDNLCSRCGHTQCFGHEGKIMFPIIVYRKSKMTEMIKILASICLCCSEPLSYTEDIRDEIYDLHPTQRLNKVYAISKDIASHSSRNLENGCMSVCENASFFFDKLLTVSQDKGRVN